MKKNETRNSIMAKLAFMVSLAAATENMRTQVEKAFADSADDNLISLLDQIEAHTVDIVDVKREIENYFTDEAVEEGDPVPVPYVHVSEFLYPFEAGVRYPSGEKLTAFVSESDDRTYQTGSVFYTSDKTVIDLAMSEIKKGELALNENLSEDNMDIDIYIWGNPFSEDYSQRM